MFSYDANLYRSASEEEIQSKLFKTTGGPGYYVDTRKFGWKNASADVLARSTRNLQRKNFAFLAKYFPNAQRLACSDPEVTVKS